MLVTFGSETWLGDIIDVKEEWNILQDNLDDIWNWSNGNRMKCKSTKCTTILSGMSNKNFWSNQGAH